MKYFFILLLFPVLVSAQTGKRLNSYVSPNIATKQDVLTVGQLTNGVKIYADTIEKRRQNDIINLTSAFTNVYSLIYSKPDSSLATRFKNDSAAKRIRQDSMVAALIGKQAVLGFVPYNSSNPSGFITNSALSGYLTSSSASGLYQPLLGFTPYNATNPSGFITSSALSGYQPLLGFTPYNSTNPSGFINSAALSGYLTSASAASTYYPASNPTGYITNSALSGYLTSAGAASFYQPLLGFTPYNATNPSGFITNSALAPYSNTVTLLDSINKINLRLRDSISAIRTVMASSKVLIPSSASFNGIALQTDYTIPHGQPFTPSFIFVQLKGTGLAPLGQSIISINSTSFVVRFGGVPPVTSNIIDFFIIK